MQVKNAKNHSAFRIPKNMETVFQAITKITNDVCHSKLNDEYAQLSRKIAATLSRKNPSPLTKGNTKTWACGIVYALGFVNFLFDKNTEPYLNATELCAAFNVSKSVGGTKAKQVKDILDMCQMDPKWCLPGMIDQNPLVWMITVDGYLVDARHAPREIKEIAFEKGLIPYIPE